MKARRSVPTAIAIAMLASVVLGCGKPDREQLLREFDEQIASQPLFKAVADDMPAEYAQFRTRIVSMVERGATRNELQDYSREWGRTMLAPLMLRHAARASDDAIIGMVRESVAMMKTLGAVDAEQCYGWMFGGAPAPSDEVRKAMTGHEQQMQGSVTRLIESGRAQENEPPDVAAAQEELQGVLQGIAAREGQDVVDTIAQIGDRAAMSQDFGAACNATISLYNSVLALDKPVAGNTLRMMFSAAG